jgi:hypothetical protein
MPIEFFYFLIIFSGFTGICFGYALAEKWKANLLESVKKRQQICNFVEFCVWKFNRRLQADNNNEVK